MTERLLERTNELEQLRSAVRRAASGQGTAVLLVGEPGIGKSSLVHAMLSEVPAGTRTLVGACEDLHTPRALGPLRDAVGDSTGPLSAALRDSPEPDPLFDAVLAELGASRPTVLVVEDAQWADAATIDVLHHVGRRIGDLPTVLVITYRPEDVGAEHPLLRTVAALPPDATVRIPLSGLTSQAVRLLATERACHDVDLDELIRLTGGNPFFVTEVLATSPQSVPATVSDAVLARVGHLSSPARAALERLAVLPTGLEVRLLPHLLGQPDSVGEAERAGVLRLQGTVVRFRHELARRAVAASLAPTVRLALHAEVLTMLEAQDDVDPFVLLHHAIGAANAPAVVQYGEAAAHEASRMGAYRQAAQCYEQVLAERDLLRPDELAAVSEAYVWSLSHTNRLYAAASAADTAVELWRKVGHDPRLVRAMVALSRQQWLTERCEAATETALEAMALATAESDETCVTLATLNLGGLSVLVDREHEALPLLEQSLAMAERLGRFDLAALSLNYLGSGRLQLGRPEGESDLLRSVALAEEHGHHEFAMRGYYNLVEGLWRLGRPDDALAYADLGEAYALERDFQVHSYFFQARRLRHRATRGDLAGAAAGLRLLLQDNEEPGMIGRETIPVLARVLARTGDPEAARWLRLAEEHSSRAGVLEWSVPTGLAWLEHAWLSGSPDLARPHAESLLAQTDREGMAAPRGEALRWMHRLGYEVEPFPGCPHEWSVGILGQWEVAAAAHQAAGDPYAGALELVDSGEPAAITEGLETLNDLGAAPAAAIARRRLRDLGVTRIPRRRQAARPTNPVGLTERQLEILRLVASGLSNPEIARRLFISNRTVDHHVSAVLRALGVETRQQAAEVLATWDEHESSHHREQR